MHELATRWMIAIPFFLMAHLLRTTFRVDVLIIVAFLLWKVKLMK
jgi:hypothetical protein